ncbi:MAG: MFS transporter [Pseudomonadota bacterium]|nr:MFS transporter [Pseudomonadota bacterium]
MKASLSYRLGLLGCLYFSQGLPFGFLSQALPALLRSYDVSLEKIGLVSLVALPWAFKFLWAPYVDHYHWQRLGQRKSWILPMQGGFMLCLLALGALDPASFSGPGFYGLLAILFVSNLIAATQDIATDGLAVSSLSPQERGLANGVQVAGYRVGMLFGGAVILLLLEWLGWFSTFMTLALMIVLVSVPLWWFREPASGTVLQHERPRNVFILARQFMLQPGMWRWVLVILVYKAGDALGSVMTKPLLIDLGYSLEQVGWISGGVGMGAGIAGALFGGWLIPRLGRLRALVGFGVLQAFSLLGFYWLATGLMTGLTTDVGAGSVTADAALQKVVVVTALEHFSGGLATAALFTLMMDACRRPLAGTDYTLQASLQVVVAGVMHSASGFSASALGYEVHFVASFLLGLVALFPILLWWPKAPQVQRDSWH